MMEKTFFLFNSKIDLFMMKVEEMKASLKKSEKVFGPLVDFRRKINSLIAGGKKDKKQKKRLELELLELEIKRKQMERELLSDSSSDESVSILSDHEEPPPEIINILSDDDESTQGKDDDESTQEKDDVVATRRLDAATAQQMARRRVAQRHPIQYKRRKIKREKPVSGSWISRSSKTPSPPLRRRKKQSTKVVDPNVHKPMKEIQEKHKFNEMLGRQQNPHLFSEKEVKEAIQYIKWYRKHRGVEVSFSDDEEPIKRKRNQFKPRRRIKRNKRPSSGATSSSLASNNDFNTDVPLSVLSPRVNAPCTKKDNNRSLSDRNEALRAFCEYGRRDPNNANPVHHVPQFIFPNAILSKKYDGHFAIIQLDNDAVVMAEMCSTGGFRKVTTDISTRGNRNNLYYYIFDVLRYQGCEVSNQNYERRLEYAAQIVQERPKIVEQRSRKRGSSGNNEQPNLRGLTLKANVAEFIHVNTANAAWEKALDWAKDRTETQEAIEGGVLTVNRPITSNTKRYKLKPFYDGEIQVQTLHRGGTTQTHDRITSVSGVDMSNGITVNVRNVPANIQVGQIITFRRHYCVSGEGTGVFQGCKNENVYHRKRTDDAYRNNNTTVAFGDFIEDNTSVNASELRRKKASEARATKKQKEHMDRGHVNRDVIGRWLQCEQDRTSFDDCPFEDRDRANDIRDHVEDVSVGCRSVPMAVMQYVRLPETHALKKNLDSGKIAKYKGEKETYTLSATYDRKTKSGKRSTAWDSGYTWPKLGCTCRSWIFANHACTTQLQSKGSRGIEVTRANQLRLCKHWIDAIQNPNSNRITYADREPARRSGGSGSSGSSRASSARLTSAMEMFEHLPENDEIKQILMTRGKHVQIQGSRGDWYDIRRQFMYATNDTKGIVCSCPSYQEGKHRVGNRHPYGNIPIHLRLCKHTLQLFDPNRRQANWKEVSTMQEL